MLISLQNISVKRQGNTILNDISLEIEQNQHVAIIGPNGAGKSFLMRIIAADIIPSSGIAEILGQKFGEVSLWDLRKQIGYVATRQAYWYDEKASALEIVLSGYSGAYGVSEKPSASQISYAQELLEFFHISNLADRPFSVLSDGERRKCLLARALVIKPKLLIFDEPCQGLDIPTREALLKDIDRLAAKTPILYVTHHLEELPNCITDVALIKAGELFAYGPKSAELTSAKMTKLFDYPLEVENINGKFLVKSVES